MESRLRKLRENKHVIQEMVAYDIGITQQTFSKYERDITCAKVDVLIKIAQYFNVTTDYLLGLSDIKRNLQSQLNISKDIEEYYEIVEAFKGLDEYDKELLWNIMLQIKKVSIKRKEDALEEEKW